MRFLIFAFSFVCSHLQVSNGLDPVDLQTPPCDKYMPANDVALVKNCKRLFALRNGLEWNPSEASGCLGNRQMLDSSAVLRLNRTCVENSLAASKRKKRGVAIIFQNAAQKWVNPIFFVFSLNSSTVPNVENVKANIRSTLTYIRSQTCLQFVEGQPKIDSQPYIRFIQDVNCLSYSGRVLSGSENKILVNEACWNSVGLLLNLISQSLGLFLEIQRFDRDNYISVQYGNIPVARQTDFATYSANFVTVMGTDYDFSSVMHPPPKWLSSNNQITLKTINALMQNTIGQRVQYSFQDTQMINNIYCQNSCGVINAPVCQNNGYQNPASCSLCKCPDGYSGNDCSSYGPHDGQCSTQIINLNSGNVGFLQSPGYSSPGFYTKGTACSWSIKGPVGTRISISFVGEFSVYCDNLACNHWVEIRYKKPLYSLGPRMCCGTTPATTLLSDANEVLVLFRTLDTVPTADYKGFQLRYSIETAPCVPTFTRNINTNSPNGLRNSNINNLADCTAFCNGFDACVAIDWDSSSNACWYHQNSDDLKSVGVSPNVDQYVINRSCTSTISTATTTTSSSTTTTAASTASTTTSSATTTTTVAAATTSTTTTATPSTSGGCILWTTAANTNSPGGTFANGASTLDACRGACAQNPTCVAVDFDQNTTPNSCWIHASQNDLNVQSFMLNVQQHRVSRGCSTAVVTTVAPPGTCPTWSTKQNSNSPGGSRVSNVQTLSGCLSICADDARCVAVDFDSRPEFLACWAHYSSSDLTSLFQTNGVTQYQLLVRCPTTATTSTTTTTLPSTNVPTTSTTTTTTKKKKVPTATLR